jgi:hypothetical protein
MIPITRRDYLAKRIECAELAPALFVLAKTPRSNSSLAPRLQPSVRSPPEIETVSNGFNSF